MATTISPSDQAADLLHNLSLDAETMVKVPDTGNKDVYGGTKTGKTNLLPNNVRAVTGLNQKKLAFNQKGSYGTYPTGYYTPPYQYPRYGYDMNYASGKTNISLQYPHLSTYQGRSGSYGQSFGYNMDSMYSMYGPYMSGYGYDSYGYGAYKQTPSWYKTMAYGFSGYGKENFAGLDELNRGPRAKGFKIGQESSQPETLKEQEIEKKTSEDVSLPDSKDYNKEDFSETYSNAKLFVIKSYSEDDIHKSIKYNVWSSTPNGNKKLDAAYNEAKEKSNGSCPVFLMFSVNTSGQFVGLAEMVGPVDFNQTVEYWQQDKWIGCFPVKWHIVKDIPNSSLRHITLENNENKPVTNSRDTQEVNLEQCMKVIKIFKEHASKTCILDDFVFYESREKIIKEGKKKQQQYKKKQALAAIDKKPGIGQSALQLPSPVLPQQTNEVHIDDRSRVPSVPSNEAKPLLPSSSNISVDVSVTPKNPGISTSSSTSAGFVRPARGATSTRFGSALNIETLVAAAERRENAIEAPPSDVQDKISFIINNISLANIESKGKDFAEILPQQYYPWFAQYMVMKRASIEPNFHDLYLKFLDKVDSKLLFKEILQNTYENCKVLLGSELIKSSSEERSLLKNLGSWLGKLTIGRNHVLRAREIDPKSLIVEAYEKGLMIAVIPFTSKVLEPCQNSIAYQPPNPWTMAILGLLAEIYSMPNLKMNLKFDIEVLFKNLGVDLKEVAPTSLLKDRKREIDGNPDFSNKDLGVTHISQPPIIQEPKTISPLKQIDLPIDVANTDIPSKLLSQYVAPQRVYANTLMEDEKVATLGLPDQLPSPQGLFPSSPSPLFSTSQPPALPNIGNHVVINQKLSGFGTHFPFPRVVPLAMDRAIKDIVSGIVQRSVCIACQTTKELVLKDYALEPDETRIYSAAHLMVASLAGSLAHVTCKEPLRTSISGHLRSSLQGNIKNEALEQIVQLVTNDNLDLGCAAIEQAATEKAVQTIDADIAQQLLLRRKPRDGAGSSLSQNSVSFIPESLRPKPGQLSLSQQRVYEDFVQLPWQKQSTHTSHGLSAASSSSGEVGLGSNYGPVSGKSASDSLSGAEHARMDMVSRASDLSVEGFESPVSLLSSQVDPAGETGDLQFSNSISTSELSLVESSDTAMKETGTSLQTLTSAATMERLGGSNITQPSLSTRDALDKYHIVMQKMEDLVANNAGDGEIQVVVSEVPEIILRCISRDEAALAVAQKAFKALYENASSSLHVSANLAILVAIRDVCKRVVKELTSWVIYSEEERKLNKDITIGLIQRELLNLAEYNVHMAKHLDGGRNKRATDFSISLLQSLVTEESSVISELHSLVDALAKLSSKSGSPESLQQLIDIIRNPVTNTSGLSDSASGNENNDRQSKDEKVVCNTTANTEENASWEYVDADPAGFRNRVSTLFKNWYQICEVSGANETACSQYVSHLHQTGLLKGDDTTESFFRILLELSVAHCISSEEISSGAGQSPQQAQSPSFLIIDIYAKLVFSVLKYFPEQESSIKLFLLSEIMAVTVRSIQKDAEDKKTSLNPRPYFRLFINWLLDLCSLDPGTDGTNFQVLTAFANAFHALQPLKVPAFSFAWLELVSHRSFMPKMLTVNGQKGWPYVQRLLVDLLQFLEPFLRNAELGGPVNFLYKGTLRVLLVLLHDFPEFLCDYHFTFCDVIPSSCIQMRNIILSSFPRNMRLPDPSTPNLKIDLLPEIVEAPCILSGVDAVLKAKQMKNDVDEYLTLRQQNSTFLSELKQKLLLSSNEASSAGTRYNVPLINSLVLYTGMQAIQQLQAGETQAQNVVALHMFKYLSMELDTEGRYLFLNAIANQLRYPNNHTHYFSFIMLYLFFESNQEIIIQEQITRVLLERLIVNRPHPWGLLITFIELIKNPRYGFWQHAFIRCAPEIEKLFESVARSCGSLKPVVDEGMVSGWADNNH